MAPKKGDVKSSEHDGASPGKIFIGGLAKDTSNAAFTKHFGKYGDIIDSVIMKDRHSGQPRGFGFVTYADPSVVDKVIEDTHVINGKQVEIKRTIPKGSSQTKDFKTKKIFVGGIPTTVTEEELKKFFTKYGKVVEHEIIHDHATKRSRGFGFIIFDNEKVVDELLSKGNMIDLAGSQVEIKKAEPKKASNPPGPHGYGSEAPHRAPRPFDEGIGGGFGGGSYSGYGDVGFGPSSYRTPAGLGPMMGGYGGGYGGGASDFGSGGYGGGLGAGIGGYRGESSLGYSSRLGLSRYGREEGLGGYGVGSSGYGAYESGPSAGYGSAGLYGRGAGGYGSGGGAGAAGYGGGGGAGAGRYHPYGR